MDLGFGGCGTVEKAPPEFLEISFCELLLYGVLGDPHSPAPAPIESGLGAFQRTERNYPDSPDV